MEIIKNPEEEEQMENPNPMPTKARDPSTLYLDSFRPESMIKYCDFFATIIGMTGTGKLIQCGIVYIVSDIIFLMV